MESVFYTFPTAEWQVLSVSCLLRNDKCFLYLGYRGMTSLFYTFSTAE